VQPHFVAFQTVKGSIEMESANVVREKDVENRGDTESQDRFFCGLHGITTGVKGRVQDGDNPRGDGSILTKELGNLGGRSFAPTVKAREQSLSQSRQRLQLAYTSQHSLRNHRSISVQGPILTSTADCPKGRLKNK